MEEVKIIDKATATAVEAVEADVEVKATAAEVAEAVEADVEVKILAKVTVADVAAGAGEVPLFRSPSSKSKSIFYKYASLTSNVNAFYNIYVLLRLEATTERTFTKEGVVKWGDMRDADLARLEMVRTAEVLVEGVMFFAIDSSVPGGELDRQTDLFVAGGKAQKFYPPEWNDGSGLFYELGKKATASACPVGGGPGDNWRQCKFAGIYGAPGIQTVLNRGRGGGAGRDRRRGRPDVHV